MRVPEAVGPLVRVWRHPNYAWFIGGMAPSLVTSWMQRIGVGWLAWEMTHQNAWVGAIVAADYAPMLLLAPYVGALTDRSDPVEQQKLAQWLALLQAATVALLTLAGLMTIYVLFVLSLFLGCLHPFNAIARHAIVPASVPRSDLPTALAVDSAIFNLSRFIGPTLAGGVIAMAGAWPTFAINSLGCGCYLVGLYAMRLPKVERHAHGSGGMLTDIRDGLRYVCSHPGIGPLFLLMTLSSVLIRPLQDLLPGFAAEIFGAGAAGLGWLTAAMGVGATCSAVFIAVHGRVGGLTLAALIAYLVNVLATLAFIATHSLWIGLLSGALWGAALTLTSTATQALVQTAVDDRLRGRAMSFYTMIYRGWPFIGALAIGAAADRIGLQQAFFVAAVLAIVPWLVTLRRRDRIIAALEGRVGDHERRLRETCATWAGLAYEQSVDAASAAVRLASRLRAALTAAIEQRKL